MKHLMTAGNITEIRFNITTTSSGNLKVVERGLYPFYVYWWFYCWDVCVWVCCHAKDGLLIDIP